MHIHFNHTFPEPIWRLIPSFTNDQTWVVELRNGPKKEVSFFFIDSNSNITQLDTQLDWWTGIEAVAGKNIVFHHYLQPDLPLHQGIKVFDAQQNTWLWENEFVVFASADANTIEAKSSIGSIEQRFCFEIETGNETNAQPTSAENIGNQAILISDEETYFNEIAEYINKFTSFKIHRILEYVETETHIIVSYYVPNKKLFDNYLLVTTSSGEECIHLCLSEGMKGVAAGTFHVSKGLLSFVKEQTELFIVEID